MRVIGIDAGGSKTRALSGRSEDFTDSAAHRIDAAVLGPGNYRQLGAAGIRDLAREIVARHRIEDPAAVLVVGGFAGAGTPESHRAIEGALAAEGFRRESLTITSDAGLLLAALGDSGLLLIAGTGSICMGRAGPVGGDVAGRPQTEVRAGGHGADPSPKVVRAGGYGYRLPSEPGGYFLGIRALDAALKIQDGRRQPATQLYAAVRDHLGLENFQEIVPLLYPDAGGGGAVQERVAGLAGAVLQAAAAGDEAAAGIVGEAVSGFADHIRAVHQKLSEAGPAPPQVVGLHGGLFADPHADQLLIAPLTAHPDVAGLGLSFRTLGVRTGDPDPLIEAVNFTLRARSSSMFSGTVAPDMRAP